MSGRINWGDPSGRKDNKYGDRRRSGPSKESKTAFPMPINYLSDRVNKEVTLHHWIGNELTETIGILRALDQNGNVVIELDDGTLIWFRGATVQKIEFPKL